MLVCIVQIVLNVLCCVASFTQTILARDAVAQVRNVKKASPAMAAGLPEGLSWLRRLTLQREKRVPALATKRNLREACLTFSSWRRAEISRWAFKPSSPLGARTFSRMFFLLKSAERRKSACIFIYYYNLYTRFSGFWGFGVVGVRGCRAEGSIMYSY